MFLLRFSPVGWIAEEPFGADAGVVGDVVPLAGTRREEALLQGPVV